MNCKPSAYILIRISISTILFLGDEARRFVNEFTDDKLFGEINLRRVRKERGKDQESWQSSQRK